MPCAHERRSGILRFNGTRALVVSWRCDESGEFVCGVVHQTIEARAL